MIDQRGLKMAKGKNEYSQYSTVVHNKDLKTRLKRKIDELNGYSDFFKSFNFNVDAIEQYDEKTAASFSLTFPCLYFWIDCLDEFDRFCFAYDYPSILPNSLLKDIIPRTWWCGYSVKLGEKFYNKILFEIDHTVDKYFNKYRSGGDASEEDVNKLIKIDKEKSSRYLVFYLKKDNELESVKKFEENFQEFNNWWKKNYGSCKSRKNEETFA